MIFAIANQKGGVLKTTTVHNLSTGFAMAGKKVLAIDMDPQASLTISMGQEPGSLPQNVCNIMRGASTVKQNICNIREGLDLIPSSLELAGLEAELSSKIARESILARALGQWTGLYDYIFIDCPPQLSLLTINALTAADRVIIPCKTDYISYRGLEQIFDTIDDIRSLANPSLVVTGVIATLYEVQNADHNLILKVMEDGCHVIGTIKKAAAATKGIYDGKAVIDYLPRSEVAAQYRQIIKYIQKEEK